jgi:hypothetical protein
MTLQKTYCLKLLYFHLHKNAIFFFILIVKFFLEGILIFLYEKTKDIIAKRSEKIMTKNRDKAKSKSDKAPSNNKGNSLSMDTLKTTASHKNPDPRS